MASFQYFLNRKVANQFDVLIRNWPVLSSNCDANPHINLYVILNQHFDIDPTLDVCTRLKSICNTYNTCNKLVYL